MENQELMKPGSVIINTARGELIDEAAHCEALAPGQIMGAGLDTFEPEPPAADSHLEGQAQARDQARRR